MEFNKMKQIFEIETEYDYEITEIELLGCLEDTIGDILIKGVKEVKND